MEAMIRERRAVAHRPPQLGATDPAAVFTAKSLLYPLGAVTSLICFIVLFGEPLYGINFLLVALSFVLTASVCGVANIHRRAGDLHNLASLFQILQRWCLVIAFISATLYLSHLLGNLNLQMYVTWAAFTPFFLWGAQIFTIKRLSSTTASGATRRAVIVGVTELGLRLERHLHADAVCGTEVLGYFEDRSPDRVPAAGRDRILGRPSALAEYIAAEDIHVVYVALPMTRNPRMTELLEALHDSTVSIYFIPDFFTFDLIQARFDVVCGMPVVAVRESPFYGARTIAKRVSDIILATALLVPAAPVMLAVAIGVRLSSPGPVVFKQWRYGLDGRQIAIFKFRSMTVMEDGDTQYRQVTRNDSRVTPFGAFIRKLSLDELPQLFNVLGGSLSMVGPRPHAIAVNEQYRRLIPSYMARHKVKPGITGWAQINGYRGGDDLESMRKRIQCDLYYLRNWSLMLDLSIIFRTVSTVWKDSTAY